MKTDTILVPISDLHSGSTKALFPKRFWQFKHNPNFQPSDLQKKLFDHWSSCAEAIKKARRGKRVIVVHNGDAIEGFHHCTPEVVTTLEIEQIEVHIELMDYFMQKIGWEKTDQLYYVTGTETHTNDGENKIGEDLGAVPNGFFFAWDELKIKINGKEFWFSHHGPTAGKGANRGNAMRAWLRNIFYDWTSEGLKPPDYIITGHSHTPDWGDYIGRLDGGYHKIQGLICPSWQNKTRYAYKKAPHQMNKIGMQYIVITGDGLISDPVEMLL